MDPLIATELLSERLRRALAEPTFLAVPIGETLDDYLEASLLRGSGRLGPSRELRERLLLPLHWMTGAEDRGNPLLQLPSHRLLLAFISNREHLIKDLVPPLVDELGPSRCNVLGEDVPSLHKLPADTGFARWRDVEPVDVRAWRREYRRCAPAWSRAIRSVCREAGMPRALVAVLEHVVLVQSQRVARYTRLLQRLQPAAIVTDFDRHMRASCLVLAANAAGIPTATLMRGVINCAFSFTPLLADLALVWGEQHRERYLEYGTAPERLQIVGSSRFTRALASTREQGRAKVGLDTERPVVMLATSPIVDELRDLLAEPFCAALADLEEVAPVVRLHPSESLADYRRLIEKYPRVRFTTASQWTIDESLAAADVVVIRSSGFGSDALIKRRLVIVLDVLPSPLGHGEDLIERAGAPRARSAAELRRTVLRIVGEPRFREQLCEARERYVPTFCAAFGREAAAKTANAIAGRLERRIA